MQGFDGAAAPLPDLPAQTPEAIKCSDNWGQAAFAGEANDAALILDFTKVTKNLQFKIHPDRSIDVTDGENTASAARVAKVIGGAGDDTFSFERLPDNGLVIETNGSGDDVLDLSKVQDDLTYVTHVDGSLSVSDSDRTLTVNGAISALSGAGRNTFVEEKAPVIAGTINGGVFSAGAANFSLAAYAATHAAPSQIVIIDPSVANFESLLKGLVGAPVGAAGTAAPAAQTERRRICRRGAGGADTLLAGSEQHRRPGRSPVGANVPKRDDALVLVLDANWDGVEQITQILAAYQGLAAVQIISHGSSGALRLGNATLNSARLEQLSDRLKNWKQSIVPGGDLLLYGCDVAAGEQGLEFIRNLSELTGADVAASTNATGGVALGGDWVLESSTGVIETASFFAPGSFDDYAGLLGAVTVNGDPNTFVIASATATVKNGTPQNVATARHPDSERPRSRRYVHR